MNPDTTLIYPGGDVKALGGGRVAGYLVRFNAVDVQGDVFLPSTDFGLDVATKSRVVYDHGLRRDDLGRMIGNARIGTAELSQRPDGIYAEATLDTSKPAVKSLYDRIEAGGIGWSSGSVDRLVVREASQENPRVRAVKSWPLIEATLTPIPVDPNNRAVAIKALVESPDVVAASLVERSERLVADAAEVVALYDRAVKSRKAEGRNLSEPKRVALVQAADALAELVRATRPRADPEAILAARRRLAISEATYGRVR